VNAVRDIIISNLEPFVGGLVATMCVRAAASELGKTPEELVPADLPDLEDDLRERLSLVMSEEAVERVMRAISLRVGSVT
jgi:hypothetical protein